MPRRSSDLSEQSARWCFGAATTTRPSPWPHVCSDLSCQNVMAVPATNMRSEARSSPRKKKGFGGGARAGGGLPEISPSLPAASFTTGYAPSQRHDHGNEKRSRNINPKDG